MSNGLMLRLMFYTFSLSTSQFVLMVVNAVLYCLREPTCYKIYTKTFDLEHPNTVPSSVMIA